MPRRPAPLPDGLVLPFRVRDTTVTRRRTRGRDLLAPTSGARLAAASTELLDRCRSFALMLPPDAAFSHSTAARLLGLPLPWWLDDHLHAIVPSRSRIRRAGLTAHRHTLADRDVIVLDGVRLTTPSRTWCDLAEVLDVTALTVVGDHIAHRIPEAALTEMLSRYRARRGRRALRAALALVDGDSESQKETELRLLMVAAGFGPFSVNHEVFDEVGTFVARVDLALAVLRIAIEYEGDHHRDRDQWRRDVSRRRRLEAIGWTYLPVTQADLSAPHAILRDLQAAVASR